MEASTNAGINNIVNRGISQLTEVPEVNSLDEFIKSQELQTLIAMYSRLNPNTEHIYTLQCPHEMNLLLGSTILRSGGKINIERKPVDDSDVKTIDTIVAGSYALWTLCSVVNKEMSRWKAGDIDIFCLGKKVHGRMAPANGLLDLVHTKEDTPEKVIANFDLPCCRVAFDTNYTFYVSIHALAAITSKNVYLPLYLKEQVSFMKILKEYPYENGNNSRRLIKEHYHKYLCERMTQRIYKYQSRGFSFKYYETDYILPWIKERFHYIDWTTGNEKNEESSLEDLQKQLIAQEECNNLAKAFVKLSMSDNLEVKSFLKMLKTMV